MTKERIVNILAGFPDEVNLDDFCEHLQLVEKVEEGLAAIERGDVMTIEEAERRLGL